MRWKLFFEDGFLLSDEDYQIDIFDGVYKVEINGDNLTFVRLEDAIKECEDFNDEFNN